MIHVLNDTGKHKGKFGNPRESLSMHPVCVRMYGPLREVTLNVMVKRIFGGEFGPVLTPPRRRLTCRKRWYLDFMFLHNLPDELRDVEVYIFVILEPLFHERDWSGPSAHAHFCLRVVWEEPGLSHDSSISLISQFLVMIFCKICQTIALTQGMQSNLIPASGVRTCAKARCSL